MKAKFKILSTIISLQMLLTACGQYVLNGITSTAPVAVVPVVASLRIASPASPVDFGSLSQTAFTANQNYVFQNSGGVAATGCSVVLSDTTNFHLLNTTCSSSLAAGASCSANVNGQPTTAGLKNATVSLSCTNGGSPVSISSAVSVTGGAPAALNYTTTTSGYFSAGIVGAASTTTNTFTIHNVDTVAMNSCAVYVTNPTVYSISNSNCGSTLAAGASCSYDVTATPNAVGSLTSDTGLNCTDGGATSYGTLYVTGGLPQLEWETTVQAMSGSVSGGNSTSYFHLTNNTADAVASGCHVLSVTGDVSQFTINGAAFNSNVSSTSGVLGNFMSYGAVEVTPNPSAPGSYSIVVTGTCDNNATAGASTATLTINLTATP